MRHFVYTFSNESAICGASVPGQHPDYATTDRGQVQCPACLRELRLLAGDYDAEEVAEYLNRASKQVSPAVNKISAILTDPSASRWIRNALQDAIQRDIVDATNDAEVLAEVLRQRAGEVLGTPTPVRPMLTVQTCRQLAALPEFLNAVSELMADAEPMEGGLTVCCAEKFGKVAKLLIQLREA